jgi:hypothetical protein
VYRDNVTEGIKSGRGKYWMIPAGLQHCMRVEFLSPSFKQDVFRGVANAYRSLVGNSEGKSLIAKCLTSKRVFMKLRRECLTKTSLHEVKA